MGGVVEAILRKYNLSQGAAAICHVGPSAPSHLGDVERYSFGACPWPLWEAAPLQARADQVHHSFMILHASSLEAKAMICSSGPFHPHAAPGTEMVIELKLIGYSGIRERNNSFEKHVYSGANMPGMALIILETLTH